MSKQSPDLNRSAARLTGADPRFLDENVSAAFDCAAGN